MLRTIDFLAPEVGGLFMMQFNVDVQYNNNLGGDFVPLSDAFIQI